MQACVEDMRRLAAFLSRKYPEELVPIDPGLIRYEWNKAFGCIDFVDGTGLCPVYGEASIPLRWHPPAPVPPAPDPN